MLPWKAPTLQDSYQYRSIWEIDMAVSNVIQFPARGVQQVIDVTCSKAGHVEKRSCWDRSILPADLRSMVGSTYDFVESLLGGQFFPDAHYRAKILSLHFSLSGNSPRPYFLLSCSDSLEVEKVHCDRLRFDPDSSASMLPIAKPLLFGLLSERTALTPASARDRGRAASSPKQAT